jgi:type IX secretion system PorP/SprF family membrane protein
MKKCTLFILITCLSLITTAQDPLLTQKTGNLNHFNPAFVGTQSDFGVNVAFRNQWPLLPRSFVNSSLLANYNLKKGFGFGLELKTNIPSLVQTDELKANVNYGFTKNEIEVRFGANLGLRKSSVDWSQLQFEDQIDPSRGFVNPTAEPMESNPSFSPIFDLGASAYYRGVFVALSVMQLNQPNFSLFGYDYTTQPRLVGSAGYNKRLDAFFNLAGLITYQQQDKFSVADFQVTAQYKHLKLGIGNRQSFGVYGSNPWYMINAGVQYNKFSVSYSYDYNKLDKTGYASHEVIAAWYIKGLKKESGLSDFVNGML